MRNDPPRWMMYGACKNQDPDTYFPDPAIRNPPENIKCGRCPVTKRCLEYALENHPEGVWGGTTEAQRRSLLRPRHKVHCIACDSDNILEQGSTETCLACGLSWKV